MWRSVFTVQWSVTVEWSSSGQVSRDLEPPGSWFRSAWRSFCWKRGYGSFPSPPLSGCLSVCLIVHQHVCVCVCVHASNCHFLQTLRSSFSCMWACSLQVGAHWKLLVAKWKPLWCQDTVCVPVCVSFLKRWDHCFQMWPRGLQVSAHWELVVAEWKPLCVCQYVSLSSNVEIIIFIRELEVYKK